MTQETQRRLRPRAFVPYQQNIREVGKARLQGLNSALPQSRASAEQKKQQMKEVTQRPAAEVFSDFLHSSPNCSCLPDLREFVASCKASPVMPPAGSPLRKAFLSLSRLHSPDALQSQASEPLFSFKESREAVFKKVVQTMFPALPVQKVLSLFIQSKTTLLQNTFHLWSISKSVVELMKQSFKLKLVAGLPVCHCFPGLSPSFSPIPSEQSWLPEARAMPSMLLWSEDLRRLKKELCQWLQQVPFALVLFQSGKLGELCDVYFQSLLCICSPVRPQN